jgi:hypothetical protein
MFFFPQTIFLLNICCYIYRLSAAEERFEHLCQRSEKDIVKMKQLARKNASLRQKIKVRSVRAGKVASWSDRHSTNVGHGRITFSLRYF